MKNQLLFPRASACIVAVSLSIGGVVKSEDKPESLEDRVSYAYGMVVARDLKERGLKIDVDQFMSAFRSATAGEKTLMDEGDVSRAFDENRLIQDEQNAEGAEKENLMAGKKFLEENAKKDGVKVSPRGLQYKVLKDGDGKKPSANNVVKVHYHGTLIDGTVFDSSVDRGEPISFPLTKVIPGWTEGLQLMPLGSKYRLFIPYHLAYGDSGAGPQIKPYSALVFDVELLEIN